jgi:polyisoprenoid-binding protein YceI
MKFAKLTHALILSVLFPLSANIASAAELEADPAHSSIGFEIKHLMISTIHGEFTNLTGAIKLDEKNLEKSTVNFKVKTDSISTNSEKRDAHLKSPDFFDVAKYPEVTFVSTSIKPAGKDKYTLVGDLTIHGVTKKSEVALTYLGKVRDPYGVERRMFHGNIDIVRSDFGLIYNAKLESGGVLIGDTAKLTIDVEAIPKAPKQAGN